MDHHCDFRYRKKGMSSVGLGESNMSRGKEGTQGHLRLLMSIAKQKKMLFADMDRSVASFL